MKLLLLAILLVFQHGPLSVLGGTVRQEGQAPIARLQLPPEIEAKIATRKRLTNREKKIINEVERNKYKTMLQDGFDEVSNNREAIQMRNYKLRNKKRKGLLRKRQASLAEVLFPGVAPDEYLYGEIVPVFADLVESRKNPVPYEFYDLPFCQGPSDSQVSKKLIGRKNLGSALQGHDIKLSPFQLRTKIPMPCTPVCAVSMDTKTIRWMQKLVKAQYRVQLTLDRLPVLMRSKEHNFAMRGYPIGFQTPKSYDNVETGDFFLFNHLKFIVTYHEKPGEFENTRITGFDVHPVSIEHNIPNGEVHARIQTETCNDRESFDNDPESYMALKGDSRDTLRVMYSYEVEWVPSDLEWADRWDVYIVGAPDDDLHYFSIVNSLMIVLFLTGAIGTIMIRTLRKDISLYNEMDGIDDAEETGWKLVHGDVFRPPQTFPMVFCVVVGTGAQICVAFGLAMLAAVLDLLNPIQKGQTLTALIILYVLCGSVAGYISIRLFRYMDGKAWKTNLILTATALPGFMVAIFMVLNVWLTIAGAATAVSIFTIIKLFLLWICVSAPMVFAGGAMALKSPKIEVPTRTNQIARIVPEAPWHVQPQYTIPMGGVLPFGSVCIELAFIMSALWLHQIYYVLGFLLAVLLILVATCAQVSIVLTYLQLCAEDHRWWWTSFFQCASAGGYLFLYSLWFLSSRLEMVGLLPVVVYLTYMGMISICFGLVCGSVGFLSAFIFTRTIYGAVKVD